MQDCVVDSTIFVVDKRCNESIRLNNKSVGIVETLFGRNFKSQFIDQHFRKRPVVMRGSPSRVSNLREMLFDLDIKSMLENSASEQGIHVWLRVSNTQGQHSTIESMSIEDANQAYTLYRAGHSLYCRAPPALEADVISRALNELGIGVLGSDSDRFRRGEIETFFSRRGHVTDFHTDFQENLTIQLSGKKKWTFATSTAVAPLRGVTPHFSANQGKDVAEQQLKAMKVTDADFSVRQYQHQVLRATEEGNRSQVQLPYDSNKGHRKSNPQSVGGGIKAPEVGVKEIVLSAGDVLYHPAGIWHKVECIEDSISINISLIGASYAEVFCCGLQQLLWSNPEWRAPVAAGSAERQASSLRTMGELLRALPALLQGLSPGDLLPSPCFADPAAAADQLALAPSASSSGNHVRSAADDCDGDVAQEDDDDDDDGDGDASDDGEDREGEGDSDEDDDGNEDDIDDGELGEDDEDDGDDDEVKNELSAVICAGNIRVPFCVGGMGALINKSSRLKWNPCCQVLSTDELGEFGCDYSSLLLTLDKGTGSDEDTQKGSKAHSSSCGSSSKARGDGSSKVTDGASRVSAPQEGVQGAAFIVHCSFGNESLESLSRRVVVVQPHHLPFVRAMQARQQQQQPTLTQRCLGALAPGGVEESSVPMARTVGTGIGTGMDAESSSTSTKRGKVKVKVERQQKSGHNYVDGFSASDILAAITEEEKQTRPKRRTPLAAASDHAVTVTMSSTARGQGQQTGKSRKKRRIDDIKSLAGASVSDNAVLDMAEEEEGEKEEEEGGEEEGLTHSAVQVVAAFHLAGALTLL